MLVGHQSSEWSITDNVWVLSIVKNRYYIQLKHPPPKTDVRLMSVNKNTLLVLSGKVDDLFEKIAVVILPSGQKDSGFYSI